MGLLDRFCFIFLEPLIFANKPGLRGLVKIQCQGAKGRLKISLQGYHTAGSLWTWLLYHQGGTRAAIKLGFLEPSKGEKSLEWEFNPLDVEGTGLPIEEFSEFLVTEQEGTQLIDQTRVLLKGRIGAQRQAWQASEG